MLLYRIIVCVSCLSVKLVYCGQTVGWIKMKLGIEVGLGSGHIVLDGDPAPPRKKGHSPPQFSAHVRCGQTALWIEMPFSTEVGLGPGHIVLDGDPAPLPKKGAPQAPQFSAQVLWANGWMDQDATWYRSRPRPRPYCVRSQLGTGSGHPAPSTQRGMAAPLSQFTDTGICINRGPCLLWPNS